MYDNNDFYLFFISYDAKYISEEHKVQSEEFVHQLRLFFLLGFGIWCFDREKSRPSNVWKWEFEFTYAWEKDRKDS